ncbi:hypothetical protein LJC39_00205 [Parabacteroides sp. OttesenSCG-928-B22]|nr:hypothetical protein [Parabacteroides sp. OttesenSCG-928-B22]
MANFIKKYYCTNFGNCKTANSKALVEITDGEEQICPECKKRMLVPAKTGPNKLLFIVVGVIAVACIAGGVIFFTGKSEPPKEDASVTVIDNSNDKTVEEETTETATGETMIEKDEETESPKGTESSGDTTTPPTVMNGDGSIDFGYAIYTGKIKDGKPHGNGTLEYKKRHQIISNKDYYASPGEKFIGSFREGKVNMGTWYQKDGNEVVIKQ